MKGRKWAYVGMCIMMLNQLEYYSGRVLGSEAEINECK
jgi:hypothetical protein